MIINLTVFIYEPLYWRVTADVVFVALFPSNRRLFSEIVAYQKLFWHGNATGELEQPG